MDINYCRREIGEAGTPCMGKIDRANALSWCAACRERLPLWPATIEAYEKHIAPAVTATIEGRQCYLIEPGEVWEREIVEDGADGSSGGCGQCRHIDGEDRRGTFMLDFWTDGNEVLCPTCYEESRGIGRDGALIEDRRS